MIPLTEYEQAAAYLRSRLVEIPQTAVVLGSGLGRLAREAEDAVRIPYTDIPGFPQSTVASHAGLHYYEGYDMETVCFYVRVLHLLGVRRLVLTNAAGGINDSFQVGDLMLITDHLKFFSESPSRGQVPPVFGERFFDMSRAYTPALREIAAVCAAKLHIPLREGIYAFMPGPQFETPEVIAASQCGMEVLGISCITNLAAGMVPDGVVSDEEVTVAAGEASGRFCALVTAIAEQLAAQ